MLGHRLKDQAEDIVARVSGRCLLTTLDGLVWNSLLDLPVDDELFNACEQHNLTLPSSLQSLTFGDGFNQSLDTVNLPSSLQSLTFGHVFNQSLDNVTLPSSLQSLTFGFNFNQSLDNVTLPSSLQSLTFGVDFNQSLDNVNLPISCKLHFDKLWPVCDELQVLLDQLCDYPLPAAF